MKEALSIWRPRIVLIVLAILFLAPVITAWWLHWGLQWRPAETINHGVLVAPPRRLDIRYPLLTSEGTPLRSNYLRGRWTLVTIGDANCAAACANNYYKIRQVAIAQGKNMRRVQRLNLIVSNHESPPYVVSEYPGMDVAVLSSLTRATFLAAFSFDGVDPVHAHRVYLVDPLGNLMMYYHRDAEPAGMLKDLRRLLKISSIG